jgi:hypothetical protein
MSVLGFLQQLEQKLMFTNVNVKMTTKYEDNYGKIMQCLFHLIPMIASVDSIEFQGAHLIYIIIYSNKNLLKFFQQNFRGFCRSQILLHPLHPRTEN